MAGAVIFTAAVLLAGCGNKNASPQKTTSTESGQMKNNQNIQDTSSQKMPEATGKVDDTVNAIIDGANSESAQAESTDSDATAAVGDGTDTNNLNNTYDQNAL